MDEHISASLREQIRSGQVDEQTLRQFAQTALSPAQQSALQALLHDPQALEKLMQSEKAQALLRRMQP